MAPIELWICDTLLICLQTLDCLEAILRAEEFGLRRRVADQEVGCNTDQDRDESKEKVDDLGGEHLSLSGPGWGRKEDPPDMCTASFHGCVQDRSTEESRRW